MRSPKQKHKKLEINEFLGIILHNEQDRSLLLASIAMLIIVIVLVVPHFSGDSIRSINAYGWLALILLFASVRALFYRKLLPRWKKAGEKVFNRIRYLNAFIEVNIPTLAIIFFMFDVEPYIALLGPIVFLYFLFIMLSSLELNFKLGVFTGAVAAIEYTTLVWYIFRYHPPPESAGVIAASVYYYARGGFLLLGGFVAGYLGKQFRQRAVLALETVQERNRLEKLFGQQVSPEVVNELLQSGYEVSSRRRNVTVMFLDIRDYSIFAEHRSPEEVINFQNLVFGYMIDVIHDHKGIINQFLGDGFMATFGAPVSRKNACQDAVDAALQICEILQEMNARGELPGTRIGIGIDTGEVITGNVGTSIRKQYSITGNVVILASRIEQLNKQYGSQILISKQVADRLSNPAIKMDSIGEVKVKGRAEPIGLLRLA